MGKVKTKRSTERRMVERIFLAMAKDDMKRLKAGPDPILVSRSLADQLKKAGLIK